jgi:hypothetical protein
MNLGIFVKNLSNVIPAHFGFNWHNIVSDGRGFFIGQSETRIACGSHVFVPSK